MRFERENNINYMVMECVGEPECEYDVGVVERGLNPRLLPMHIRRINKENLCYYDITARQQLAKMFTYIELKWEDVCMICESIADMVREVNRYMLDLRCVRLAPEYMYVDLHKRTIYFTYFPGDEIKDDENFDKSVRNLFDYVLEHFDHNSSKENVMKVYEIYQRIVQNNYDAERLDELICEQQVAVEEFEPDAESVAGQVVCEERIKLDIIPAERIDDEVEEEDKFIITAVKGVRIAALIVVLIGAVEILMPTIMPLNISMKMAVVLVAIGVLVLFVVAKIPVQMFIKVKERSESQPCEIVVKNINESEDLHIVPHEMDDVQVSEPQTMLLSEYIKRTGTSNNSRLSFINCEKDERMTIEKFPAVMGSMKERCQLWIDDNLVSRIHCCINKTEEGFSIEDLNSTNGTKINGRQLLPDESCIINSGDEILLATTLYKVEIT